MIATLAFAPLLMAQAATAQMVDQQYETHEVAFEELLNGETEEAIALLEAELADDPHNPAAMINLGSAHMQAGNVERAQFYYRAAADCHESYELELASGRWVDSREAALLALATVEIESFASR